MHELMANMIGWERPLTYEEKLEAGAMSAADFYQHYKTTGGRLAKN